MVVRKWRAALMLLAVVALGSTGAWAGALGGGIDGFLNTWQAWCIGLGIIFFMTGGAGWLLDKMGMFHSPVLSGALNVIVPGGIFGAMLTIAGTIGLAAGGTLPL